MGKNYKTSKCSFGAAGISCVVATGVKFSLEKSFLPTEWSHMSHSAPNHRSVARKKFLQGLNHRTVMWDLTLLMWGCVKSYNYWDYDRDHQQNITRIMQIYYAICVTFYIPLFPKNNLLLPEFHLILELCTSATSWQSDPKPFECKVLFRSANLRWNKTKTLTKPEQVLYILNFAN